MRPIRLTMTAFGPYAGTQVIDFTELQGQQIFVISGKVGAGKTSIFDAISFALFGEASGEDRSDVRMLRSDFARDELHTSVDLLFELRGRTYRIFRQQGHVKTGKKTATGDKCELYSVTGESEQPLVDRMIKSVVDKQVEALLGITRDQFRQIVMLAQGEFMKLLLSDTENKEAILRRLFRTSMYKAVADELKERVSHLRMSASAVYSAMQRTMQDVQANVMLREGSTLAETFKQETTNEWQVLLGLTEEASFYADGVRADEAAVAAANEQIVLIRERRHQASLDEQRFVEREALHAQQQELERRAPEMKQLAAELADAERAERVRAVELRWRDDVELLQQKQIVADEAARAAIELRERVAIVDAQVAKLLAEEATRTHAHEELRTLEQHVPRVEQAHAVRKQLAHMHAEHVQAQQRVDELSATRSATHEALSEAEGELAQLRQASDELPQVLASRNALEATMATMQSYVQASDAAERARADLEAAERASSECEMRLAEAQQLAQASLAAQLAHALHEGQPCPVCGSVDHPQKASTHPASVAEPVLEQLQLEARDAAANAARQSGLLDAAQRSVANYERMLLDAGLAGITSDGVNQLVEQHEREVTQLNERIQQLERCRAERDVAQQVEQKLRVEVREVEAAMNEQAAAERTLAEQVAEFRAQLAQLEIHVPEALRDAAKLQAAVLEARQRHDELQKQWNDAQEQQRLIHLEQAAAKAQLAEQQAQLHLLEQRAAQAGERYHEALLAQGFESAESYEQAQRTDERCKRAAIDIEQYRTDVVRVEQRLKELDKFLENKERVSLPDIDNELAAADEQLRQSLEQLHARNNVLSRLQQWESQLHDMEAEFGDAQRELTVVEEVYLVLSGKNEKKISFERYVQMEFLDRILAVANDRLRVMSSGQYEIMRSERQESHGKQGGLSFDVFDQFTGMSRDVRTLSGGEKFNASLCLALALSDVIQAHEGGISLETMFIDEGFGHLDEESLTKAIDTLIELQQSGRMIGIISHIEQVKQAIPATLEVVKRQDGSSTAKFTIR